MGVVLGPAQEVRKDALEEMTPELSLERGQGISPTAKKKKQTASGKDARLQRAQMCLECEARGRTKQGLRLEI